MGIPVSIKPHPLLALLEHNPQLHYLLVVIDTGLVLRCDVFVDTIHRIEITTTTRELLLDEAPEVFDVRAFDEEGGCVSWCIVTW